MFPLHFCLHFCFAGSPSNNYMSISYILESMDNKEKPGTEQELSEVMGNNFGKFFFVYFNFLECNARRPPSLE